MHSDLKIIVDIYLRTIKVPFSLTMHTFLKKRAANRAFFVFVKQLHKMESTWISRYCWYASYIINTTIYIHL